MADGEIGPMMRRARAPVGAADDRQRVGGVLEQFEQRADRAGIGGFGDRRHARAVERLDLVAQHVLGDGEHDRAGAAGGGDAVGAGDIFGDAARIVDPRRPFGDRREEGRHVDFLEALAVAVGAVEVADEQDHRGRILEGDMDAGAGIGRARAARDEGDAGPPGHLAVGVGHVGDPAFLPADDGVDLGRVVERVEHGEEAFAGDGENAVAALDAKLVDKDLAAGALGHVRPLARARAFDKASPALRLSIGGVGIMGAWGSGSFENDTAMDWAAEVQSLEDVRKLFAGLKQQTDGFEGDGELELDADFACELLAAAECVATLMGRRGRDFPDDLAQRLEGSGEPDNLMFHQARNAVLHVMRHSELAELWEEAGEDGEPNEWLAEMTRLIDRLNPEVEVEPWDQEHIEANVGAPLSDGGNSCAFCNGPIAREQLWGINVYDAFNMNSMGSGFWLHLPCLNARLHHKHAIADLKFDPDNLPDLDQL